jgi:acylphosphatase
MPVIARRLMIRGLVQGVFFRAWTVDTAKALGLVGWVRNRSDGSVEALVQGEAATVDHFIVLARNGPPAARVDAIEASEDTSGTHTRFEQRATA